MGVNKNISFLLGTIQNGKVNWLEHIMRGKGLIKTQCYTNQLKVQHKTLYLFKRKLQLSRTQ